MSAATPTPRHSADVDAAGVVATAPANPAAATFVSPFAGERVTFLRMLKSEWLKLWTLRSTWWTLALTVVLMAGLALLFSAVIQIMIDNPGGGGFGADSDAAAAGAAPDLSGVAVLVVVIGYQLAQLTVAILGVLAISNEYGSGMIRATFSAAPRRLRTLWAKLIVLTVTTVIVAVIGLALAWLVSYPILNNHGLTVDFGDSSQVRAILGTVLYLIMVAWLALGVGTILRHTAGGISAVIGALMVLPMIFGLIVAVAPTVEWVGYINRALPSTAGEQLILGDAMAGFAGGPTGGGAMMGGVANLEPWVGFAVLAAYAVVALVVGAFVIKRRDA